MSDEEMLSVARWIASASFNFPDMAACLLDDSVGSEDAQNCACLAQQIIAEATGLVGLPEVYET